MGTARWKGGVGNRGRPALFGGCGFNIAIGDGTGGSSDRGVGLSRPGNSGGGKAPDFWRAFEDDEDRAIGDEPHNARSVRSRRRKLYCKAKAGIPCRTRRHIGSSPWALRRSQSESRMPEIGTSGLMSGEGKRGNWLCLTLPRPSSTLLGFPWSAWVRHAGFPKKRSRRSRPPTRLREGGYGA